MADATPPLFSFGVIADIQYCDTDDASNFAATETRRYRDTLRQAGLAAQSWNEAGVLFVAQLGDLIDGQNAGGYGAGLRFDGPQSEVAFEKVVTELQRCTAPMYHAIGNHELYNFDWPSLRRKLNLPERGWRVAPDEPACEADFSFVVQPVAGWSFLMLNAYEVSVMQHEELDGHGEAVRLMREYNPNDVLGDNQGQVDYFSGLSGRKMKYVPFNGGVGARQMQWLRKEVVSARERGDRIVILSHLPVLADASSHRTLMYDCDEVLRILHEDGCGHVVAVFAGHLHRGGYAVDGEGVHHVTLRSPLSHDDCFGRVEVYDDRLELRGNGEQLSFSMPFPPLQKVPPTATPAAEL
ncbi:hypothetical protein AB1Y20_016432 [Prymnesium parvum]|uniref:Calcineurin-like phosphoesterase domain-containing protein n=1 Tax=Prymnesium parvum TaxID=97485 RepID=A0AB34IF83_PRYPA